MIDRTRPARSKRAPLPPFTPVPRQCNREDGWTPDRQCRFIEALADTGSVKSAARAVNMAPEGVYQLRRHAEAGEFRKAWEAALSLGVQRLEDIAMERAIHGIEVPVYSYGQLIGSRIVHNDRLLMFLLRHRAPDRFAAGGRATSRRNLLGDPLAANRLSRLKKQWRKEWEAEREAEAQAKSNEGAAALNAKLSRMQQHWLDTMSPRTRRLHDAWQRSADLDAVHEERRREKAQALGWRGRVGKGEDGGEEEAESTY